MFNLFKKYNVYASIEELPIYNWWKIHANNDLSYIVKSGKCKDQKQLLPVWDSLFFEFIDTFGIPTKMIEILELKRDIRVLEIEKFLTRDKGLETFIEIKKQELIGATEVTRKENVDEVMAYVEKSMGFRINERELSVKKYYTYIELLKAEAKAKTQHGR